MLDISELEFRADGITNKIIRALFKNFIFAAPHLIYAYAEEMTLVREADRYVQKRMTE